MRPAPTEPWLAADRERGRWLRGVEPFAELRAQQPADVPPLLAEAERLAAGGAWLIGLLSFEAVAAFAPLAGALQRPRGDFPLAWFRAYRDVAWLPAPPRPTGCAEVGPLQPDWDYAAYQRRFDRTREYIAAGDIYQVNLTFPRRAAFAGDPYALAHQLWSLAGPCYGAYIADERWAVGSSSPELFFTRAGDWLTTRPMKGTRPRGRWPAEDDSLAEQLALSAKDRAENLMIVDLLRNDLGRIATPGSVCVTEPFTLEAYPTVWQQTTTVRARSGVSLADAFAALFPCASVIGAPKYRALQIIGELEPTPRNAYCGAIGWVGPGRQASFGVAIRTAQIDRGTGTLRFDTGSGLVWDSTAVDEYAECAQKAAVLTASRELFDLLETLRWRPGEGYFLLDAHLDRLRDSAAMLSFVFDWSTIAGALDAAAHGWSTAQRVRLTLTALGRPTATAAPLAPLPAPYTARLAPTAVDPADRSLYHKTTARARYDAARAAADASDALLHNTAGDATEFTIGNLVFERDGQRYTPPLRCGLLPGVYRAHLLATGAVHQAPLRVDEIEAVDRLWMVNAVREWVPVTWLG